MAYITEVIKIRRNVLAELARLAFADRLEADIHDIFNTIVTEDGVRYRCCVHKERAVLKDRINLALSQPVDSEVRAAAGKALTGDTANLPVINVLPEACDQCPIDKFLVTDACRNCLAHNCINSCPKKAIVVVQNKAYIDKNKCVECGLCKKACPYGAIIEISRPCERVCDLQAIQANTNRKAVIDYEKCISCGACITACPFGAIGDSSEIVQLIQVLKSGKKVYAMLAPAFVGQFGVKASPGQLIAALKKMGFYAVREVSTAADLVVIEDAKEFTATVPQADRSFMTTSCCPAFALLIRKHLPELAGNISSVLSPMDVLAKWIKQEDPEAVTVFIGPCVAKKGEAKAAVSQVDFVLTFEELAAMLVGAGINLAEESPSPEYATQASHDGNGFACSGGVCQAVENAIHVLQPERELSVKHCEGVGECKQVLQDIRDGKLTVQLMEGMACVGGCVGGPGSLADVRAMRRQVEKYMDESAAQGSFDNPQAVEQSQQAHAWHRPK